MDFRYILVLMLLDLSLAFSPPVDTVIVQVQQWGVVGAQRVMHQVLLNGAPLTDTRKEVDSILQTLSADALLPAVGVNMSSALSNHTVLRSRECTLEGSQLHWSDRVFYDGTLYLTLERNDTWTAHVPEALALKVLWDQEGQRTRTDRIRLQEGCIKLMRELKFSEELPAPQTHFPWFVIPVMAALMFIAVLLVSILSAKKQGLRHPGGVLGSVIHYPQDMTEMTLEVKGSVYQAL